MAHNGIIENHVKLGPSLATLLPGQTDSEVIVQLFERCCEELGDALLASRATIDDLHGVYAIILSLGWHPRQIFISCKRPPLQVGLSDWGEKLTATREGNRRTL